MTDQVTERRTDQINLSPVAAGKVQEPARAGGS